MMKLYGVPPTRALRVIWLLNELGLECELIPVNVLQRENRRADFARRGTNHLPMGRTVHRPQREAPVRWRRSPPFHMNRQRSMPLTPASKVWPIANLGAVF